MNDENGLDDLFRQYRAACPSVEPSVNFMPALWQRIEARQSFWNLFQRSGKTLVAVSAALCLLLLVLNLFSAPGSRSLVPSYTDALMADHSAEKTYYAEAIRSTSANDETLIPSGH